ncbi:hypothetical protein V6B14_21250 [Sporosarcina psychrophila]
MPKTKVRKLKVLEVPQQNAIEAQFGEEKPKYGLGHIQAQLQDIS